VNFASANCLTRSRRVRDSKQRAGSNYEEFGVRFGGQVGLKIVLAALTFPPRLLPPSGNFSHCRQSEWRRHVQAQ